MEVFLFFVQLLQNDTLLFDCFIKQEKTKHVFSTGTICPMDVSSNASLDLNLWISPPLDGPKRPENPRKLQFNFEARDLSLLKRMKVCFANRNH